MKIPSVCISLKESDIKNITVEELDNDFNQYGCKPKNTIKIEIETTLVDNENGEEYWKNYLLNMKHPSDNPVVEKENDTVVVFNDLVKETFVHFNNSGGTIAMIDENENNGDVWVRKLELTQLEMVEVTSE